MEEADNYLGYVKDCRNVILEKHEIARVMYTSPETMAEFMQPDSPHNHIILDVLDSSEASYLRITPAQLLMALRAKKRRIEQEARAAARQKEREAIREKLQRDKEAAEQKKQKDREAAEQKKQKDREAKDKAKKQEKDERQMETFAILQAELGGVPTNEREFIALKTAKDTVSMSFDRLFKRGEDAITAERVLLDMHLTAADLALVKPRGDLLSATNIDRAFQEWCIAQRQACLQQVCERIFTPPEGVESAGVIHAFEHVCGLYFQEPIFAARAVQKMIWQIKRMIIDMPVEQRHMLVFCGEQNCGKTYVQRMITNVIREVVAEACLKDVLDERQMELPTYPIILLDELVSADRADVAALKNFITGADWSRRPMRTNLVEKIKLRASLFGTSNHSLGKLIYDSSGMRRFIELMVLPRASIEANWHTIISFNWMQLWQAVDAAEEDPLMAEFADLLMAKQEELRNADNTETWLRQYELDRYNAKSPTSHEYTEWFSADLYQQFSRWETEYDRGYRGTSLTRWGREMKSLIDAGHIEGWSHLKYGAKTVYRYTQSSERNSEQHKSSGRNSYADDGGTATLHRMDIPRRRPFGTVD